MRAALPALPVGTAFFASAPLKIAERVAVRMRKTFNSGATPKPGERKQEAKGAGGDRYREAGEEHRGVG